MYAEERDPTARKVATFALHDAICNARGYCFSMLCPHTGEGKVNVYPNRCCLRWTELGSGERVER